MTLPNRPNRPGVGEYATITKAGEFKLYREDITIKVVEGERCVVIRESRTHDKKRIWVYVRVFDEDGKVYGDIEVPWWWLTPRTVLDDIAVSLLDSPDEEAEVAGGQPGDSDLPQGANTRG